MAGFFKKLFRRLAHPHAQADYRSLETQTPTAESMVDSRHQSSGDSQQPVQLSLPATVEQVVPINMFDFAVYAKHRLERWMLLGKAVVDHPSYGLGKLKTVKFRDGDASSIDVEFASIGLLNIPINDLLSGLFRPRPSITLSLRRYTLLTKDIAAQWHDMGYEITPELQRAVERLMGQDQFRPLQNERTALIAHEIELIRNQSKRINPKAFALYASIDRAIWTIISGAVVQHNQYGGGIVRSAGMNPNIGFGVRVEFDFGTIAIDVRSFNGVVISAIYMPPNVRQSLLKDFDRQWRNLNQRIPLSVENAVAAITGKKYVRQLNLERIAIFEGHSPYSVRAVSESYPSGDSRLRSRSGTDTGGYSSAYFDLSISEEFLEKSSKMIGETEAEAALMTNELAGEMDNWARSNEGGWFYSDVDHNPFDGYEDVDFG